MKRGQIGTEYIIIVSFITLAVSVTLLISQFYMEVSETKIKTTQIENFANKIISSSESVYYSGEPSKTTIEAFLPENVNSVETGEHLLIINYSLPSGKSKRGFRSNVPINGTIPAREGIKKIEIQAKQNFVNIKEVN